MIRKVTLKDGDRLVTLLEQLGYPHTEAFIQDRVGELLNHSDEMLVVYEEDETILALLSLHIIPQIALLKPFLRISYFIVDEGARGKRIGEKLEAYATEFAREKACDRIEVHCHERRKDAHRFYIRQGYSESPKYFMKML